MRNEETRFLETHSCAYPFSVTYPFDIRNYSIRDYQKCGQAEHRTELRNVICYFVDKKKEELYGWELDYATVAIMFDALHNTEISETLFGYSSKAKTKECAEYVRNFELVLGDVENGVLDLYLLMWTVYKTYRYLRNKRLGFIFDKGDLPLIALVIRLCFALDPFSNLVPRTVQGNALSIIEAEFLMDLLHSYCFDLIQAIIRGFPDDYRSCGFIAEGEKTGFDKCLEEILQHADCFDVKPDMKAIKRLKLIEFTDFLT